MCVGCRVEHHIYNNPETMTGTIQKITASFIRNILEICSISFVDHFTYITRFLIYYSMKYSYNSNLLINDELFDDIGCSVTWITENVSKNKLSKDVIIYLHGGGFTSRDGAELIFGTKMIPLLSQLLGKDKAPPMVCGVMYTLATSTKKSFPKPTNEIISIQYQLKQRGYNIISICGDSAGGSLALSSLIEMQEQSSIPIPPCAIAISPVVDCRMNCKSIINNCNKDFLNHTWMLKCRYAYLLGKYDLSEEDREQYDKAIANPLASMVFASKTQLLKLPPLLLMGGGDEMIIDDVRAFANQIKDVHQHNHHDKIRYIEAPGELHIYPYFDNSYQSTDAFIQMARFIQPHCCLDCTEDVHINL